MPAQLEHVIKPVSCLVILGLAWLCILLPWTYPHEKYIAGVVIIMSVLALLYIFNVGVIASLMIILFKAAIIVGYILLIPKDKVLDREVVDGSLYCIIERLHFYEETDIELVQYHAVFDEVVIDNDFYMDGQWCDLKIQVRNNNPCLPKCINGNGRYAGSKCY